MFPSLVASAVATTVFIMLTGQYFGMLYTLPAYTLNVIDLFLAVPLGLAGALVGAIFILAIRGLSKLVAPLNKRVIVRGLIGGLVLGLVGALVPLVLFSGEEQTNTLIQDAAAIGVIPLIGMALVLSLIHISEPTRPY